MPYIGKTKRPKGRVMAKVIRKDGTEVDLGTIAGSGRNDPVNIKKGKEGRDRLARLDKEARHGG